jgi:transmembrane sensor
VLRKMSLPDAVAEFNRYNRRQLVIEDPALREIRVGGNFQSNNVDGFVRLLQAGFAVRTEERSDRIILTRAAPTE